MLSRRLDRMSKDHGGGGDVTASSAADRKNNGGNNDPGGVNPLLEAASLFGE